MQVLPCQHGQRSMTVAPTAVGRSPRGWPNCSARLACADRGGVQMASPSFTQRGRRAPHAHWRRRPPYYPYPEPLPSLGPSSEGP
eukprot:5704054-Pyramimonas_sp.AAC.1